MTIDLFRRWFQEAENGRVKSSKEIKEIRKEKCYYKVNQIAGVSRKSLILQGHLTKWMGHDKIVLLEFKGWSVHRTDGNSF